MSAVYVIDEVLNVGDVRIWVAQFRNRAGDLTDTTVTASLRKPDGTVEAIAGGSITKTAAGTYDILMPAFDMPGVFELTPIGAGTVTDRHQVMIPVKYPSLPLA